MKEQVIGEVDQDKGKAVDTALVAKKIAGRGTKYWPLKPRSSEEENLPE